MEVAIFECDIEEEMKKIGNDKYEDGFDAGFKDCFNNGFNDGFNNGRFKLIADMYTEKEITLDNALAKLDMTKEDFLDKYNIYVNGDKN